MPTAISIKDLHKTYDNGHRALSGINLEVAEGDFFALLGANGAGKSTTIGIVATLVRKSAGSVEVFGKSVGANSYETKLDLGIVPQEVNFGLFEKVKDICVTQGGYYGLPRRLAEERSEKYLKKLGLWDKKDQQARNLSGGMKRRLLIARALIHEPRLLILDEPTAGVDIELRRSTWKFLQDINKSGTTIILTTHYLEEAESLCRNIAIIDQGEIVENTSMRVLLKKLDTETFIFDSREDLLTAPQLNGFEIELIDSHCFEITLDKSQDINEVFSLLDQQGVKIKSMRNKTNRLEQLFVSLLQQSKIRQSQIETEKEAG
ncbi:MAG: ABC transporter ATP-binding protein [Gammaproteobacteria bacterium]|nr:ABC transporter ATP-binding protein [Gammaproteobacteria bacterium]